MPKMSRPASAARTGSRGKSKSTIAAWPAKTATATASSAPSILDVRCPRWPANSRRIVVSARLITQVRKRLRNTGSLLERGVSSDPFDQLEQACEVARRQEFLAHTSVPSPTHLSSVLGIAQEVRDRTADGRRVRGVDERTAYAVDDLVLDAANTARHHRALLPHRFGDRQAEPFGEALLDDDGCLSLQRVHDRGVLVYVIHRQAREMDAAPRRDRKTVADSSYLGQGLFGLRIIGRRVRLGSGQYQVDGGIGRDVVDERLQ